MKLKLFTALITLACMSCQSGSSSERQTGLSDRIPPTVTTQKVRFDSDDPAIWINRSDPTSSLVLGTDKDTDGALYVFDLNGTIVEEKVVRGLRRPNNVDVEYDVKIGDSLKIDIAALTEREAEAIRLFSVPDMMPLDGGGIPVFVGEKDPSWRAPMGLAVYRNPETGSTYVIVGRKSGPVDSTYLWQYLLEPGPAEGTVAATLVRKFGAFLGGNEIEAIAVDDRLGFVYYCEEGVGVRKYYADPGKGNAELALFGVQDFAEDAEGIAILETSDSTGLILISDQQAHAFNLYSREGTAQNPHTHRLLKKVLLSTRETDGCEVTAYDFDNRYPGGLFVAMSDDKTFQFYSIDSLLAERPSK